ncbi:MAG: excinuclease ABC subunit UvrC [candidate division Zixibacteria bacterium]|nr:excinuclease ABC subunit UvrC [candidate division Zixibacteria bacterium]
MTESLQLKLAHLPRTPGVYLMKDKTGKIIYIGKAKNLKNRVSTYFHARGAQDAKTARLVAKIADIELLVTDSEIEALILEANLVKEHKPRYNVNLKDDKRFPYLKLTMAELFPRLLVTRRVVNDGAKYFGPYTNAFGMRKTWKFLMRHFGLRSCNLEIPSPTGRKYKVCLDYHIGRCGGPCENLQTEEQYRKHVEAVILFLSGRRNDLVKRLQEQMNEASEAMHFEEAARLRDTIIAMDSVQQKQKVDSAEDIDRDVVAFAREESEAAAVVLQIREGILIGRQDIQLKTEAEMSNEELLAGFLHQYYNHSENLPEQIFLPVSIDEAPLIEDWLSGRKGSKVKLVFPQKGEKQRLVVMAETNARLVLDEMLLQKRKYQEKVPASAVSLQQVLKLDKPPLTISCFDISNLGQMDKAASLVYFVKGKPKKSEYRHFKIKTVEGQDDFACMREVITRYVGRRVEDGKPLPDLMMVDGGKGQLLVAREVLDAHGRGDQPVIGLAKRLEEVFVPRQATPVSIPKTSPAINLLKRVRDEAHRFAVSYHRTLRNKRTITSELEAVKGVGKARLVILLNHFGSVEAVKQATLDDLSTVAGIPKSIAQKVHDHLHPPSSHLDEK